MVKMMKNNYRVIKILDDTSLIINAGSEDNIKINDIMEIYGESENIYDPLTNENLGKIEVIKDRLKVSKVYKKMCVCESSLFNTKQRKMNVDPIDISGNDDKSIRIGDSTRIIKIETTTEKK